jgi:hypothetical protein
VAQRVIIEMLNGHPCGALLDNGSGDEYRLIITEVSPVYSNARRRKVRIEMYAEVEERAVTAAEAVAAHA